MLKTWTLTCDRVYFFLHRSLVHQAAEGREGEGGVKVEPQHEIVHLPCPPLTGVEEGGVPHKGGEHALDPAGLRMALELLLTLHIL